MCTRCVLSREERRLCVCSGSHLFSKRSLPFPLTVSGVLFPGCKVCAHQLRRPQSHHCRPVGETTGHGPGTDEEGPGRHGAWGALVLPQACPGPAFGSPCSSNKRAQCLLCDGHMVSPALREGPGQTTFDGSLPLRRVMRRQTLYVIEDRASPAKSTGQPRGAC